MPTHPSPNGRIDLRDVSTRAAGAADRPFAETLYLATMLPLLTALGRGDEQEVRARFARGYRAACSEIVECRETGIGWIQVSEFAAGLHLDQIHLIASARGSGLGTRLLGAVLARAERAKQTVGLDVIRGNPALRLYKRLGFRVVGEDEEKHRMLWRPQAGCSASDPRDIA